MDLIPSALLLGKLDDLSIRHSLSSIIIIVMDHNNHKSCHCMASAQLSGFSINFGRSVLEKWCTFSS